MPEVLHTLEDQVRPEHTGLLIIDTQNDFVHEDGEMSRKRGIDGSRCRAVVPRMNGLIRTARDVGVQVMYVGVVLRPDTTLASQVVIRGGPDNLWPVEGSWGARWYDGLDAPQEGDLEFQKYTYDAFRGTTLRLQLQALGLRTLVLAGFGTEVCVETTARTAFAEGYHVIIPRDCTAAFHPDNYGSSLSVLDRYFGKVVTADELEKCWTSM
jgi:nicotinamidase-related amidase